MLFIAVSIFAVIWAFFFEYMVCHPMEWARKVDQVHNFLRPYKLSWAWMKRLEKGMCLKIIVGLTTFVALLCLALMLHQRHGGIPRLR